MTHYQTLDVDPGASFEEIKRAYRRLVRQYHPDVAGPEASDRFCPIQAAYEVLSDPAARRQYDLSVGWGRSPRTAIPYRPAASNSKSNPSPPKPKASTPKPPKPPSHFTSPTAKYSPPQPPPPPKPKPASYTPPSYSPRNGNGARSQSNGSSTRSGANGNVKRVYVNGHDYRSGATSGGDRSSKPKSSRSDRSTSDRSNSSSSSNSSSYQSGARTTKPNGYANGSVPSNDFAWWDTGASGDRSNGQRSQPPRQPAKPTNPQSSPRPAPPPPPPQPTKLKSYEQRASEVDRALKQHRYSDACEIAELLVAEYPQRVQAQRLFVRAYHLRGNEMLYYKQYQLAEVYLYEALKTAMAHNSDLVKIIRSDLERAEIDRRELGVS